MVSEPRLCLFCEKPLEEERRPEDFGHAPDLAVVYWDDEVQRPAVADGALLRAALGADWRAKLRERVDGKAATRTR